MSITHNLISLGVMRCLNELWEKTVRSMVVQVVLSYNSFLCPQKCQQLQLDKLKQEERRTIFQT